MSSVVPLINELKKRTRGHSQVCMVGVGWSCGYMGLWVVEGEWCDEYRVRVVVVEMVVELGRGDVEGCG